MNENWTTAGVKYNIGEILNYCSQFSSNGKVSIIKNPSFKSDKNLILSLKTLKRSFHQEWWHHTKLC